ncbi:hypothetical protein GGQ84_000162 [Desulfitispora alkaliphila]|uniref:DUF3870 domain-containing protein n=1 Tax=Desulfitispora alkaliphila TaxID=622674 RepID=UPI003D1AA825
MNLPDKVFITGYAKLPTNITAAQLYKVIGVGLLVGRETGTILDADISITTKTGKDFCREILVGQNINDIDNITRILNHSYLGHAKKSIISAMKSAHKKYLEYKENEYIDE